MEKQLQEAEEILRRRFGKDPVIALATVEDGRPYVRSVNAFYSDGAFYILTHRSSKKIRQIGKEPTVALAGDWFTAHGIGEDLGAFGRAENGRIAERMREVFSAWIDHGHSRLDDEDTCILRIRLTGGELLSHGTRYVFDFSD